MSTAMAALQRASAARSGVAMHVASAAEAPAGMLSDDERQALRIFLAEMTELEGWDAGQRKDYIEMVGQRVGDAESKAALVAYWRSVAPVSAVGINERIRARIAADKLRKTP